MIQKIIWIVTFVAACGLSAQQPPSAKLTPVRIILVGDSTVATKSGWGPGFCADVTTEVTCVNMAKGGRSSKSYRAEGSWNQVMDALQANAKYKATYVLLQFGHNDQPGKPGRSTELATEFPANMKHYVEDLRSADAYPVLVTSLSRRQFKNGRVVDGLGPWAEAVKQVAASEHVPLVDLHADSLAAIEKMGPVEANTLAMAPPPPEIAAAAASGTSLPIPPAAQTSPTSTAPAGAATVSASQTALSEPKRAAEPAFDYTHLGAKGATYFGRMVATNLVEAIPALRPYIQSGVVLQTK